METPLERTDNGQEQCGADGLSSLTVHDLRVSLTIIKSQAQMLQRWARRQELADEETVLARLGMIDEVVMHLVNEINALQRADADEAPPDDPAGSR
jgi:signal transduction histidine kinase